MNTLTHSKITILVEFRSMSLFNLKFFERKNSFLFIENNRFSAPWTVLAGAAAPLPPTPSFFSSYAPAWHVRSVQ
jgi:hypothetical protein